MGGNEERMGAGEGDIAKQDYKVLDDRSRFTRDLKQLWL